MNKLNNKIKYQNPSSNLEKEAETSSILISKLQSNYTNIDTTNGLEYNVDGCGCMSCGCFKSAWTLVLSPAGIAAGMAAYATAVAL